jgi:hypothetical protein
MLVRFHSWLKILHGVDDVHQMLQQHEIGLEQRTLIRNRHFGSLAKPRLAKLVRADLHPPAAPQQGARFADADSDDLAMALARWTPLLSVLDLIRHDKPVVHVLLSEPVWKVLER